MMSEPNIYTCNVTGCEESFTTQYDRQVHEDLQHEGANPSLPPDKEAPMLVDTNEDDYVALKLKVGLWRNPSPADVHSAMTVLTEAQNKLVNLGCDVTLKIVQF